jgi:hypothetical protein
MKDEEESGKAPPRNTHMPYKLHQTRGNIVGIGG